MTALRRRPWLVPVALTALLIAPLLVALVALHHTRWYPILDWAQTEIRIRDIGGRNSPLIGLAGRIGPFGPDGGSHPGPISFYLLWPTWIAFGRAAYGMLAGTVVLDLAAIGLALWIAYRRGGVYFTVVVALMIAIVMRAFGAFMLTLPWNPYLPVLWWIVVLLAVWSLLCDDVVMLPVAVFAATFCAQTHISYLGFVGGLGVLAIVVVAFRRWRSRADHARNRELLWYGLAAVAVFAVLWFPPVLDELVHKPGNLTTIRDYFSHPPESPIGLRQGLDVMLTQLNPARLFGGTLITPDQRSTPTGAHWPAVVLLAAWLVSVYGAFRLRMRTLLLLDAVIGTALVLGVISTARIFGTVWFYLLLWAVSLSALMLLTIGWTIVEAIRVRVDRDVGARLARVATSVGVAATVIACAVLAFSARNVDLMSPRMNAQMAALTPPTLAALERRAHAGQAGPYYVTWLPDPQNIGAEGYGLLNELLRHGVDADADMFWRSGATRAHAIDRSRTTLQVHLATGSDIARWRADNRFQEIAYYDPRSPAEQVEFDALYAQAVAALERDGLADRLPRLRDDTDGLLLDNSLPESTQKILSRMLALGLPAAVFIGPVVDPPAVTTTTR